MTTPAYDPYRRLERPYEARPYYDFPPAAADRFTREREEAERPRKMLKFASSNPAAYGPPSPRGPMPTQPSYGAGPSAAQRYSQGYGAAGPLRSDYRDTHARHSPYPSQHAVHPQAPVMSGYANQPDGYTRPAPGMHRESQDFRLHASPAPVKKPGLECSVCGPGAQGPWRRGPLGPYSICQDCSQIQWKAGDASPVFTTFHEALSLLDNMRLIRVASLARKASDPATAALIRRLQQGLPDNTYTRAEEYFAKRTENFQRTEALKAEQKKLEQAQAEERKQEEQEYRMQQERQRATSELQQQEQARRDGALDGTSRPQPASRALPSDRPERASIPISPSTFEAATALVQRDRSPLRVTNRAQQALKSPAKAPPQSPLRQSHAAKERDPVLETSPAAASVSSMSCTSSTSSSTLSKRKRNFPLRDNEVMQQGPQSRIIDRRRARNEVLRKKYMHQRAQQKEKVSQSATTMTPGSAPEPPSTAAVAMTVSRAPTPEPTMSRAASIKKPTESVRRGSA